MDYLFIFAVIVFAICVSSLVTLFFAEKESKKRREDIFKANDYIAKLSSEIVELKEKVSAIEDVFDSDQIEEMADSWQKGYANLMNYNVNTAYGRKDEASGK